LLRPISSASQCPGPPLPSRAPGLGVGGLGSRDRNPFDLGAIVPIDLFDGLITAMKKKMLAAYTPLPESDLARVWKAGLIVLDANVLLNLYCYSSTTRDDLLDGLATVPDRLWLPHQATAEFCLGRPRVIEQQRTKCDEALKALDQALKAFYSDTSHPFVPKDLRRQLEQAQAAVQREVRKAQKELEKMVSKEDAILARVLALFDGRLGDGPPASAPSAWWGGGRTASRPT
jgi:hypothetical protein